MKKYKLTLNEKQLQALRDACELRFRIDLCQSGDLAEIIAQINTDLSPDNPNHERIFDSYIERRNAIYEMIQALFRIACPFGLERTRNKESLILEDIYQVIRYQQWLVYSDHKMWTVDSRPPLRRSEEPLPEIEEVEE